MGREHCFEGYSKEGPRGHWEVQDNIEYLDRWPTVEDKRFYHCRYWAKYYGNTKDFWCRHQKAHMLNFHPSRR